MKNEELKGRLQESITTVKRIGDEIRLEIHLAGMELKDQWRELEPKLQHAERTAKTLSEQSLHAVDELVRQIEDFRASLKQNLNRMNKSGGGSARMH